MPEFNDVFDRIGKLGVLPVVKLNQLSDALPLCSALRDGGLPAAEITFRTPCAKEALALVCREMPEMLAGAGTILTLEQAKQAVEAGAKFIVSPGFDANVVGYCIGRGIPVIPGCVTPTEIMAAMALGIRVIKFFPAEAYGGVGTIKALSAPFGGVSFIPTGGVTLENLGGYLECPSVLACGGSYMVKDSLIKARDFDTVRSLSEQSAAIVAEKMR